MLRNSVKFVCLASIFAVSAISLSACDDSQSVTQDNEVKDENIISVFINEISKGAVNAYGLDDSDYKDVTVSGTATRVVPISAIIQNVLKISDADLDASLKKYTCNYESAADGFRPTNKGDKCAPVSCSNSKLSYLDTNTGNLVYDDNYPIENLPGCYHVKQLGKILLTEVNENATLFTLYIDGAKMGEIDLNTMSDKIVEKDGKKLVLISDIIARLLPEQKVDGFNCDFVDASEKLLSSDTKCPVRACTDTVKGYIDISSFNVTDAEGAKVAACYEMPAVRELHMTTPETDTPFNITVFKDDIEIRTINAKSLTDKIQEAEGVKYVLASDVIDAAIPGTTLTDFTCNYLGNDAEKGEYDPTSKNACSEMRSCSYAATAQINITTEKMSMTDAEKQNCHNVSNIYKIKLYTNKAVEPEPVTDSYIVNIVVDGADPIAFNAYTAADKIQTSADGEKTILASDLLSAAIKDFVPNNFSCDYAGKTETDTEEFFSSSKADCTPVKSCDYASNLTISLTNNKMFSSDSTVPSCYKVKGFNKIVVKTLAQN